MNEKISNNNILENKTSIKSKSQLDILKENFKFIWDKNDKPENTWEEQFAKNYYDKLFKEYCIADLTKYKEGK
jgi:protein FRA10AC1